jgi:hypothetical protein
MPSGAASAEPEPPSSPPKPKRQTSIGRFFAEKPKPPPSPPKRKVGRPRKKPVDAADEAGGVVPDKRKDAPLASVTPSRSHEQKKSRGRYNSKRNPKYSAALQLQVEARLKGEEPVVELSSDPIIPIPETTIRREVKKARAAALVVAEGLADDTTELYLYETKRKADAKVCLTTPEQRSFLARTARARDEGNNGMIRKEMINVLMQLTDAKSFKQAESHYDYLIRHKELPELKKFGKVVSAQATTTKRSCIRIEQQLRWHTLIEHTWAEHARLNQPSADFDLVKAHFMLNLDETGVQLNNGIVQIIGSASRKKHEKNNADCRDSITIIRMGSAAGQTGPWIFLLKGKRLDIDKLKNLEEQYGAPPGSIVIMTPSAYLNDETWLKIAPLIAKGIRSMPVIRDHPDWWVCMTLDGYGSHLLPEALVVFSNHRIEVLKEEGDTSAVNQAYDQAVAKADKRHIREMHERLKCSRTGRSVVTNQFEATGVCLVALRKVTAKDWICSFDKVNLNPDTRVNFKSWIERIDGMIKTGEQFFIGRTSLFDAMPAVWKGLKVHKRRIIINKIKRFYEEAATDNSYPWKKENVLDLVQYGK